MTQTNTTKSTRLLYLDQLRLLGTLAVILAHVAGQRLSAVEVGSYPWAVFRMTDFAVLWSVPVFVMISGALFLDNAKPLSLGKLYGSSLKKLVTAFLFWSFIYALEKLLMGEGLREAGEMLLQGRYHMWYLFLIGGLYILTPLLRKITESRQLTEYFLGAFFLLRIFLPGMISFLRYVNLPHTAFLLDTLSTQLVTMEFGFTGIYTFYYVLGFYLAKYEISPRWRKASWAAAIGAYAVAVGFLFRNARLTGSGSKPFDYTLLALAMTVGLFLFAKYVLGTKTLKEKTVQRIRILSKYTFGVYLVHALVLSQLRDTFRLNTLTFDPIVSILLIEFLAAVLSFCLSAALNRIPILRKYVV